MICLEKVAEIVLHCPLKTTKKMQIYMSCFYKLKNRSPHWEQSLTIVLTHNQKHTYKKITFTQS